MSLSVSLRRTWKFRTARIVGPVFCEVSRQLRLVSTGIVEVTQERLGALIKAEMTHFAHALKPHPLTLTDIIEHREPETLRAFLLQELPIRYAGRVHLIESLEGWRNNAHLRMIHALTSDSFSRLRLVAAEDTEEFRKVLQGIERRQANTLQNLLRGVSAMKLSGRLSAERINNFLDSFVTARIGTDIISSQYLALTRFEPASVIDPLCDPFAQVQIASDDAASLCQYHYGHVPSVEIATVGQIQFPFIPQYLNYIAFELLKNSLRAVSEKYGERCVEHPVHVTISGDERIVVIRVSDEGGGIPLDDIAKVWSYTYSTAKSPQDAIMEGGDDLDSDLDEEATPMAGFGCGLPLSRNYANYVGGRLELSPMPQHGTNAYLYLNRLGDAMEEMGGSLGPMPNSNLWCP